VESEPAIGYSPYVLYRTALRSGDLLCRLPGKECLATGDQAPRKLHIMGFPWAFVSVVQGTEVEKAFPGVGVYRSLPCM